MFKIIMIITFLIVTAIALTFACACVVGSRYEKRAEELQPPSEKADYFGE